MGKINMIDNIVNKLRVIKALFKLELHDAERYLNNSMILDVYGTQERLLGLIIARQHVVEKGLTMPETRLGFGQENIVEMLKLCKIYQDKYDVSHEQFRSVVAVLKEYIAFHENHSYKLDDDYLRQIMAFIDRYPDELPSEQLQITSDDFFKDSNAPFLSFANSRHTVRNYSTEEVPIDLVEKAIDLAKTAPSACNRQPVRVHVCGGKMKDSIMKVHKGNRGFGDRANKVLVVTTDLSSYLNVLERNCSYVDGGIFVMNLLYSLHYYHIGACTLNWSTSITDDDYLRSLLSLPDQEEIVCLICIGMLPQKLSIAKSERIKTERIITFHE